MFLTLSFCRLPNLVTLFFYYVLDHSATYFSSRYLPGTGPIKLKIV